MDILQMSFSASVLIVAVIIIRALALHKLPKMTFLVLWGAVVCRLLIPFTIPSRFSFYTGIDMAKRMFAERPAVSPPALMTGIPGVVNMPSPGEPIEIITPATASMSPIEIVWLIGMCACAMFFIVAYIKCRREFRTSLPVQNDFIARWLRENALRRTVQIRQSDRVTAPLTYGVFRPVVLLPKTTDWTDETRLRYILTHEFVHIRRFDTLTKLALAAAVCVHWFNPLVWTMYILFNRDIELTCDESVVRTFGETIKSAYALTLIGLEEKKSRLTPLVNNFSKIAIEERITAIMKIKKKSLVVILVALVLVIGVITVFVTSRMTDIKPPYTPGGRYTMEDYIYKLGFIERKYMTYTSGNDKHPVYYYNNKWVSMINDVNIWQGDDYSAGTWLDTISPFYEEMKDSLGESVCVKTIRDEKTNKITGLAEMSDSEIEAAQARSLTEIPSDAMHNHSVSFPTDPNTEIDAGFSAEIDYPVQSYTVTKQVTNDTVYHIIRLYRLNLQERLPEGKKEFVKIDIDLLPEERTGEKGTMICYQNAENPLGGSRLPTEEELYELHNQAGTLNNAALGVAPASAGPVLNSVWVWPVEGNNTVTSLYGKRVHPISHQSEFSDHIEIAGYKGSAVYAALAGTVSEADFDDEQGNYIVISHEGGIETIYGHLDELQVAAGDPVASGETIGTVGSTGKATGPFLAFGVLVDGNAVDPMTYLK